MADALDTVHDLAHRVFNAVTGVLAPASAPNKPAYTATDASQHLGAGIAAKGAQTVSGRQKQLNQAIDDAS